MAKMPVRAQGEGFFAGAVTGFYQYEDDYLRASTAIAANEIERLRNTRPLSGYEFSPVELLRDDGAAWTFVAGSQQLQDEGWVPGALFATVDKYDGHLWSETEVELYYQARAAAPRSELASVH